MRPTSYQYEAPEIQIHNTRLRGLTTLDPGNQGMENGLVGGWLDQDDNIAISLPAKAGVGAVDELGNIIKGY